MSGILRCGTLRNRPLLYFNYLRLDNYHVTVTLFYHSFASEIHVSRAGEAVFFKDNPTAETADDNAVFGIANVLGETGIVPHHFVKEKYSENAGIGAHSSDVFSAVSVDYADPAVASGIGVYKIRESECGHIRAEFTGVPVAVRLYDGTRIYEYDIAVKSHWITPSRVLCRYHRHARQDIRK